MNGRESSFQVPIQWRIAVSSSRPCTYLVGVFVPKLHERGVTDADLETIFVDKPRRLLTEA
jgi:predicted metal-dependent phosphotriesterase family hydrolase